MTPRSALADLICAKDLYTQEPLHLAPYLPDRLKVTRGRVVPLAAAELLPDDAREKLEGFKTQILKSDAELEADRLAGVSITPYWCPDLRRSRAKRRQLISLLQNKGMITFRRQIHSRVGLFFVWKKNQMIRLIVDARSTNAKCRLPPHTALGSLSAVSELDLSDSELAAAAELDLDPEEWDNMRCHCGGL